MAAISLWLVRARTGGTSRPSPPDHSFRDLLSVPERTILIFQQDQLSCRRSSLHFSTPAPGATVVLARACQRRGRPHVCARGNRKPPCRRIVLRPPQSGSGEVRCAQQPLFASFEAKLQVRDGAIHHLVLFEPRLALNRAVVLRFCLYLETLGLAAGTISQRLAAVRRLTYAQDGRIALCTEVVS